MKDETYDSSGDLLIENIKLKGNELLGKIKAETGKTSRLCGDSSKSGCEEGNTW